MSGVEEFATLRAASTVRLGERTCTAAAGTAVRVIGQPTSPGDKGLTGMLFVRVAAGPCEGYELTIAEGALSDFREALAPTPAAASAAKPSAK